MIAMVLRVLFVSFCIQISLSADLFFGAWSSSLS